MGETLRSSYISYELGPHRWRLVGTSILNRGTIKSHRIVITYPL